MTSPLGRQWPRRVPVTDVGFQAPRAPRHDPEAMTGGAERQPPEVRKVVGALYTGAVKPELVHPSQMSIRATQTHLTRGSLLKHLDAPQRGRYSGPGNDTPVLLKHPDGHHYVLDGHHRIAGAMQRGEPIHARVLDVRNPAHHELAKQYSHADDEVREAYGRHLDAGLAAAKAKGMGLYGPNADVESREKVKTAFTQYYPEHAKNPVRKELGLPPRRRR